MAVLPNVPALKAAAAIITPKQHIFLLSHMRAYTSLFGHIMGSNPAICGYYEMHMGYHSWKSLIRQKLLYFEQEEPKRGFSHMFDKVLHNDHSVAPHLLESSRISTIFSLRRPQEALPSILKLYANVDPDHEFNSEAFATRYYIDRLDVLSDLSKSIRPSYFYFDAESLKNDTTECLDKLSNWLHLDTPLSPNYAMQKKTSEQRYGDTSERLRAGQITQDASSYSATDFNPDLMAQASKAHHRVRLVLVQNSGESCVFSP